MNEFSYEEQYRRIVETAQEGIWMMGANRQTTFVNPHMATLLGYIPTEMIGQPVENFMFEPDLPAHFKRMQERRQGLNSQYECRFRTKDGHEIWTIVSANAIMNEQGQFAGSFAMFTDITNRKRIERVLQARLHLLNFAIAHSLDEVLQETLDTIGGLVDSPIGFYHFLEADQKKLSLQAWSTQTKEIFCKAEGQGLHYDVDQAGVWVDCIRERRPVIHNDYAALPHRKGMPVGHVEVLRELVVPVFRGSQIMAILGVGNKPSDYDERDVELVVMLADLAWDIAENKRGQEILRQSNEIAQAILNAATESVFLMDVDGRVIATNETTARRIGKDVTDLIGANIYDFLPPDVAASRQKQVNIVSNERKPVHFEDQRFGIWVENSIYPIFDPDGQIRRVAIYGRDITERKQAEETIQKAQIELQRLLTESDQSRRALLSVAQDQKIAEDKTRKLNLELERRVQERTVQLEIANKELEAFAYSVSHDLRAPLRALDGFSKALGEDYQNQLDEQGKHYLVRIQETADRMGQLIADLLDLSRVTRREMILEPVDLSALALQIVNELQPQAAGRKIEVDINPNLKVRADRNLMKIALENLINNAYKFTGNQAQARIQVGKVEQAGETVFFVRDNGAGFDMAYADKLFTPFQRLHSVQEFPGTGIGLVIVQRIIARHGGRLWPEAAVDQGATFYFTIHE
jgi:PAS domain S-box-containing protein